MPKQRKKKQTPKPVEVRVDREFHSVRGGRVDGRLAYNRRVGGYTWQASERRPPRSERSKIQSRVVTSGDESGIYIYDVIGPWYLGLYSADDFLDDLEVLGSGDIRVRINSPGGEVFEALAIYNLAAQRSSQVVMQIDGEAASAASIVAMGGDQIVTAQASQWFLHDPWSIIAGDADELREAAEHLDRVGDLAVGIYRDRTGQSEEDVRKALADDLELNGPDAVEWGLADALVPNKTRPENNSRKNGSANRDDGDRSRLEFARRKQQLAEM